MFVGVFEIQQKNEKNDENLIILNINSYHVYISVK